MGDATIPLDTAARRIRAACRLAEPYFFFVGAGVSAPQVPLAWQIEAECRERALRERLATGREPRDPAQRYGYWVEQAWPDPAQRSAYFRSKIEGQPVSIANLRLAHLLSVGAGSSLALTANFDDFLSRALHLFAQPHVVCDHPATTARIDPASADVQVVHVHGTYWFYDLVNTEPEMLARAAPGRSGMADLVRAALRARTPLVVGYSGWERDVFMSALRERLRRGGLGHTLLWFCFSRETPTTLPRWLREHPNVVFVVPDGPPDERLGADRVFEALLRAFEAPSPPLAAAPFAFFADRLRAAVASDGDDYLLGDVADRLERAGAREASARERARTAAAAVRDAVRRSRWVAAARAAAVPLDELSRRERAELLEALWPAVRRGTGRAADDLRVYDAYLRLAQEPGSASPGRLAHARIGVVAARLRRGHHLEAERAARDALAWIEPPAMPRARARLLELRARALVAGRRSRDAVAAYGEIVAGFEGADDPTLRRAVVASLRARAALRLEAGELDEAAAELSAHRATLAALPEASAAPERLAAHRLRAELFRRRGEDRRAAAEERRALALARRIGAAGLDVG